MAITGEDSLPAHTSNPTDSPTYLWKRKNGYNTEKYRKYPKCTIRYNAE